MFLFNKIMLLEYNKPTIIFGYHCFTLLQVYLFIHKKHVLTANQVASTVLKIMNRKCKTKVRVKRKAYSAK